MKLMQALLTQSEAGVETYFEKVAEAFAKEPGVTQRLLIEALGSREKRLSQAGCDFETLPMGFWGKTFCYNKKIKDIVRSFDPDVLFTWVNRASRKAPRINGVTVGRLGGYYDINNYARCDHLIVGSPDLVRHVVENGWPEDAVSMISNFGEIPEDLQVEHPLPELPDGVPVLLTLGRLHVKKAQDVLIRAMVSIPDAHLLIAGSGELEDELRALAQELGVSDRVHLLGLRKDTLKLFERADVCVFPSRYEPIGNVVMESWAMNTPLVAASATGPAWLIKDGTDGLLFPIDDVEACADRINQVLNDSELAESLVRAGKQKFETSFSKPVIMRQYRDLFEGLLDGSVPVANKP